MPPETARQHTIWLRVAFDIDSSACLSHSDLPSRHRGVPAETAHRRPVLALFTVHVSQLHFQSPEPRVALATRSRAVSRRTSGTR